MVAGSNPDAGGFAFRAATSSGKNRNHHHHPSSNVTHEFQKHNKNKPTVPNHTRPTGHQAVAGATVWFKKAKLA